MKKLALAVLSGWLVGFSAHAQSDLLSSVQDWTGSGTNEAGFVIDWYNGTSSEASLVWGYRWNGTENVEQMFDAIIAGDPRLFAEESGFDTGFGTAVFGIGFAATGDEPIQLSPSTPSLSFNSQHFALVDSYSDVQDGRTAANAGDVWLEGFDSGYWALYTSTDTRLSASDSDWDFSEDGLSGQSLTNGDFDGFIFAPGFNSPNPSGFIAVAPVPEPSTWAMLVLGAVSLAGLQRNRRAQKNA